jgi:molecular chaperone GrpE
METPRVNGQETPAEQDTAAVRWEQTPAEQEGSVAELECNVAELADRWRRTLADLANLRKRYARQLAEEQAAERARVNAAWLPVVDNLELALEHAGSDPATIVEGVRAVRDQAVNLLAALGYPRHDETGTAFDPTRHDAVSVQPADADPGTVVRVVRPGYGDPDRPLRPATVVVAGDRE